MGLQCECIVRSGRLSAPGCCRIMDPQNSPYKTRPPWNTRELSFQCCSSKQVFLQLFAHTRAPSSTQLASDDREHAPGRPEAQRRRPRPVGWPRRPDDRKQDEHHRKTISISNEVGVPLHRPSLRVPRSPRRPAHGSRLRRRSLLQTCNGPAAKPHFHISLLPRSHQLARQRPSSAGQQQQRQR